MHENKPLGISHTLTWIGLGVLVTLPVGFYALMAAGAGHGDMLPLTLAFPFAFILATGETAVFIVLGLQYPAYGLFLGEAGRRGRFKWCSLGLLGVHAAAVFFVLGSG